MLPEHEKPKHEVRSIELVANIAYADELIATTRITGTQSTETEDWYSERFAYELIRTFGLDLAHVVFVGGLDPLYVLQLGN